MPYNNSSKKETNKEFYAGVARLLGVTPATVKKYWEEGFGEYIIRTLYLTGVCRLPNLGTFTLRKVAENLQVQRNIDGEEVTYRVPERDVPVFTPHDTMIDDVNMRGVTKAWRKRKNKDALTQRDYLRYKRADILGVYGSLSEERIKASEEKFDKFLDGLKREKGAEEDAG